MTQPLNTRYFHQLPTLSKPYDGTEILAASRALGGNLYETGGLPLGDLIDLANATGVLSVTHGGTGAASVPSARLALAVPTYVGTKAAMAALDPARDLASILTPNHIGGVFALLTLAALSAAEQTAAALDDANGRGIYIIPSGDVSKVYKRIGSDPVNIEWFDAVPDVVTVSATLTIGSGSPSLTATGAAFTAADIGKDICVPGGGTAGAVLFTTILGITDATHATLAASAATALSGAASTLRYWTDNRASIQNCINVVLALGGGDVLVPNTGLFGSDTTVTALNPGAGDIRFLGQKGGGLTYFEGNTETLACNLFRSTDNSAKGALQFIGMNFVGTLDLYGRRADNPLYLDYYSSVLLANCTWNNIASEAMDFHFLGRFAAINNRLTNIAADGIRCRDTPNGEVRGNFIQRNGDDAIAIHTADSTVPASNNLIRERWVIDGNIIVNGGAISCLGGRAVTITNNIQRFGNNSGIAVRISAPEGSVPLRDLLIKNNQILDLLNIVAGTPSSSGNGIVIQGTAPRGATSTHSFYPGLYDTTGTAWIYTWTYDNTITSNTANPVSPMSGIVIEGNILRRTQPAAATFSAYGVGTRLSQGVTSNPAITDANLTQSIGIAVFSGGLHDSHIDRNMIKDGYVEGIILAAPISNYDYQGVTIDGNDLFGTNVFGISLSTSSFNSDISIRRNYINADPYRTGASVPNTNSKLDGSFTANSTPFGISVGSNTGISIEENIFSNCCNAVVSNVAQFLRNNLLEAGLPAAVGFDAGNKGIGVVPLAGAGYRYKIIDADPTSATFNALVTMQQSEAAAQPSAGSWVEGAFVKNTVPVLGGGVTNLGWIRLTTGSGNVAGTDWANSKVAN